MQQRNSPHLLQQQQAQQRQMGMSPQIIQRATPSPVIVGRLPTQRTPPSQQHHLAVQQQQQSPLIQNNANVSGKPSQFIQFARPGPSIYTQQHSTVQNIHNQSAQQQSHILPTVVTVHSQHLQQSQQQQQLQQSQSQIQQQQQQPLTMYRQVVSQQSQIPQQSMRYAYIQTSDGTMSVPIQQQTLNGNFF